MAEAAAAADVQQLVALKQQRKALRIQATEIKKQIKKESKRVQRLRSSARRLSVADLVEVLRMKGQEPDQAAAPAAAAN